MKVNMRKLICLAEMILILIVTLLSSETTYYVWGGTQIGETRNEIVLTEEEKAYVEQLGELTIGCAVNIDPVFYLDEETGEIGGISKDILELVAQRTGLQFRYEALPSGNITYEELKELGIDMIAGVEYNSVNAHASQIALTDPYFVAKKVIVCHKDTEFKPTKEMTLAVLSGSMTIEAVILEAYPSFQVIFYDSIEDVMEAVLDGMADGMIWNQYSIERLLHKPSYENLRVVAAAGIGDSHSLSPMIYGDGEERHELLADPMLCQILNRGIASLNEEEVSLIIIEQTSARGYKHDFSDFLYLYRYVFLISGVSILIIGVMLFYSIRMKMKNHDLVLLREEERKHHLLIEKTDQLVYEIDLLKSEIHTSEAFARKFGWAIKHPYPFADKEDVLKTWRVHPEDHEFFYRSFQESIQEKKDISFEVRLLREDGRGLWCHISQFIMQDSAGNVYQVLGLIRDIDREMSEKQRLAEEAQRDALTGLYNKEAFRQESIRYLRKCKDETCAVLFVDMDNFKEVNDTLGHMMGDQAIIAVSDTLKHVFAKSDIVGRFGGDEFCVLMKDVDEQTIEIKMHWLLEQLRFTHTNGEESVSTSASIGITTSTVSGYQLGILLEHADAALYAAKEHGKNRCKFYRKGGEFERLQEA